MFVCKHMNVVSQRLSPTWAAEYQWITQRGQSWYTNVYTISRSPKVCTPTCTQNRPKLVHRHVYLQRITQRGQSWYTNEYTQKANVCTPTCIPKRPKLVHQSAYHQRVTQRGQSWYTNEYTQRGQSLYTNVYTKKTKVGTPTCIPSAGHPKRPKLVHQRAY